MADDIRMLCDDIKKRLKPFLEDLLADDEYQAFVLHLNNCAQCREYVGAFGSLSNQIWDLGSVKVPPDFSSTVLFKLKRLKEEVRPSSPEVTPKALIVGIIVIAAVIGIFCGIRYLQTHTPSPPQAAAPPPVTRQEVEEESPSRAEEEARPRGSTDTKDVIEMNAIVETSGSR